MKYLARVTFKTNNESIFLNSFGQEMSDPNWDRGHLFESEKDAITFAKFKFEGHPEVTSIDAIADEE